MKFVFFDIISNFRSVRRDLLDDRDSELRALQHMTSSPSLANKNAEKEEMLNGSVALDVNGNVRQKSLSPHRRSTSHVEKVKEVSPAVKSSTATSPVSAYVNNRTVEKMRVELLEKKSYIDNLEETIRGLQSEVAAEKCSHSADKDKDAAAVRELQWQLVQLQKRWALTANRDSVSALIKGTTTLAASSPKNTVAGFLGEPTSTTFNYLKI